MKFYKYIRALKTENPKMLESDQENFDQKKTENPEKVSELFKITKIN